MINDWLNHVWLWCVGAAIGLGQLLASDAPLSWRAMLGRAMVSGGLGTAAGLILLAFDTVPLGALFGAAAAVASIGTSALERMLINFSERWGGIGRGPQG
jgi:hypothetical protein